MKKAFKILGIAVFIAVIGFTLAVCSNGSTTPWAPSIITDEVLVTPANSFQMGKDLGGGSNVTPICEVTLTQPFYMGKYEVTQKQWKTVMGTTIVQQQTAVYGDANDNYGRGDNHPMYCVNWYEAIVFCNKLSMKEGLTPAYSIAGSTNPDAWGIVPTSRDTTWNAATIVAGSTGYRLPTEAQWEYAAKGGNTGEAFKYSGSNDPDVVAVYGNYPNGTKPVKSKAPNGLGIYDMSGNVYEWCWDWCDDYTNAPKTDPTGAVSGDDRVMRGGSCNDSAAILRSVDRDSGNPGCGGENIGFRVVRCQ